MSVLPSDLTFYSSLLNPAYGGTTTLSGNIATTTATTFAINTPTVAFPASGEFAVQLDSEIMWCTQGAPGGSAGTLTVIRGYAGTAAATHTSGATVSMPIGGGPNFLKKLSFSDVGIAGDTANYVSSSATDTQAQILLTGRTTAGVITTETRTLNGTTVVTGAQAWGRFETAQVAVGTTATALLTAGGTSLTVTSAATFPNSGSYYIQMANEVLQVTGGQGTTTWTISRGQLGTTATAHNNGDNIYGPLPVGDVAIYDSTSVETGTAQAAAHPTGVTPATITLQSGQGAATTVGQVIRITGSTGAGQIRTIIANSGYGTDVVAVSRDWATLPTSSSTYTVNNGIQLDLSPNQVTEAHRILWNASAQAAGGSTVTYYQKGFAVNNNTSISLTSANLEVTSNTPVLPGSATIDIALATSLDDTVTAVSWTTNLGSGYGSFIIQPAIATVTANSGTLPFGAAPNVAGSLGVLFRTILPAGTAAYVGSMNVATNGTTV